MGNVLLCLAPYAEKNMLVVRVQLMESMKQCIVMPDNGLVMILIDFIRQVYRVIWNTHNSGDGCWRSRFNLCQAEVHITNSSC